MPATNSTRSPPVSAVTGEGQEGLLEATYRRHLPPHAPQVRLVGDYDHASFEARSIPAGGIFTGLDDCYHQPCDTIGNVDRRVLAAMAWVRRRQRQD